MTLEYIDCKCSAFDKQQLRWQLLSLAIMWHEDICTRPKVWLYSVKVAKSEWLQYNIVDKCLQQAPDCRVRAVLHRDRPGTSPSILHRLGSCDLRQDRSNMRIRVKALPFDKLALARPRQAGQPAAAVPKHCIIRANPMPHDLPLLGKKEHKSP